MTYFLIQGKKESQSLQNNKLFGKLLLFDILFIGSFIHSINQDTFLEQLARPWKYHIDS